jgi:hypothetical protein
MHIITQKQNIIVFGDDKVLYKIAQEKKKFYTRIMNRLNDKIFIHKLKLL